MSLREIGHFAVKSKVLVEKFLSRYQSPPDTRSSNKSGEIINENREL